MCWGVSRQDRAAGSGGGYGSCEHRAASLVVGKHVKHSVYQNGVEVTGRLKVDDVMDRGGNVQSLCCCCRIELIDAHAR